jgi:pantetheine-phosphate adenylyltransferase
MLGELDVLKLHEADTEVLSMAILFHDCVYDPRQSNNEEESIKRYEWFMTLEGLEPDSLVVDCINATKHHTITGNVLTDIMINLDISVLKKPLNDLIKYENGIFKEYQFVDIEIYRNKRIEFLYNISQKHNLPHVPELIEYISNKIYKIGIYPGSFSPFHIGHFNIVRKAEAMFDKVIIARGINPDKEQEKESIPESLLNEVVIYDGLITELFQKVHNVEFFFVRGLRNVHDIGYEDNLRKTVLDINDKIQFVYFFCDKHLEHISSSQIRGLRKFNPEFAERYLLK